MDAQAALLLDSLGMFMCSLPMLYYRVRLAPMRSPRAYLCIHAALKLAYSLTRSCLPFWSRLVYIALDFLLPFAMYDVSPGYRLLATALPLLPPLACEGFSFLLWIALTGRHGVSADDIFMRPEAMTLMRVFFTVVEIILYEMLERLTKKALKSTRTPFATLASLLPVTQLPLIWMPLYLVMFTEQKPHGIEPLIVALALVYVVVDFIMLVGIEREGRTAAAREQSLALEQQLDGLLAEYETFVGQIEAAAHMRHDIRNHLQVAEAMAKNGEIEEAKTYLKSLRAEAEA